MSNIDGIWDCVVTTPGGKESHELTLNVAEDGSLVGELKSAKDGSVMALQGGRVDGQKLTWTMQLTKPFKLTLKTEVEVDGTQLKGHAAAAMVGKAPITGTKRA